jgi:glycyl-tRNA synthetase beta subunit
MDRELLIEIGVEEVPASWLPSLTTQMADVLAAELKAARLDIDGPVESWTTPRRLTARVTKVAERQTDLEEVVSGPRYRRPEGRTGSSRRRRSASRRRTASSPMRWRRSRPPKAATSPCEGGSGARRRSTRCPM